MRVLVSEVVQRVLDDLLLHAGREAAARGRVGFQERPDRQD